jgi:ribosomal protein L4
VEKKRNENFMILTADTSNMDYEVKVAHMIWAVLASAMRNQDRPATATSTRGEQKGTTSK